MASKCGGCKHLKMDYIANSPCDTCNRKVLKNNFEPAEPVVLSAEEWVDRQPFRSIEDESGTVKLFRSKRLFTFDQMVQACETFKQNGRLERDLEWWSMIDSEFSGPEHKHVVNFYKENLKPLNKD